jgi:hypothetical protein
VLYQVRYVGHYPFIIIFALLLLSISFKVPIEQSFDKTFLFLGCYEVAQKTMWESSIIHNGDLEKSPVL